MAIDWSIAVAGVFAIFIPALILPGPDFVAVVRSSMTRGTAAGLMTTLGVSAGIGMYAALSLLGPSAILVEYQWLAFAVRIAGGCYLAWLGVRLILTKPDPAAIGDGLDRPRGNPLVFGFLVTLTNPKAVVLFTSVFAAAVTEAMPRWVMLAMIALVVASALAWYSIVALFMSSHAVVRRVGQARHRIERLVGVCFVAIGGKILADSRNPLSP